MKTETADFTFNLRASRWKARSRWRRRKEKRIKKKSQSLFPPMFRSSAGLDEKRINSKWRRWVKAKPGQGLIKPEGLQRQASRRKKMKSFSSKKSLHWRHNALFAVTYKKRRTVLSLSSLSMVCKAACDVIVGFIWSVSIQELIELLSWERYQAMLTINSVISLQCLCAAESFKVSNWKKQCLAFRFENHSRFFQKQSLWKVAERIRSCDVCRFEEKSR